MCIPRLSYIDVELAKQALYLNQELIEKTVRLIKAEPNRLAQTRYNSLAQKLEAVGLFSYALGHPLDKVRESFAQSAQANLQVFELRGTEPPIPVTMITLDGNMPPSGPDNAVEDNTYRPPASIDYSLTNSRDGLRGIYVALIAGEHTIAERLTHLLWDPPRASYLAPNSVVCTPNDVHLANAFKALLDGRKESVGAALDLISARKAEDASIVAQGKMMNSLVSTCLEGFREGLRDLLEYHKRQATSKQHRADPQFFLCLAGIALSIVGVRRALIPASLIPVGDAHLPLELITCQLEAK
jgi:hypothetical protein